MLDLGAAYTGVFISWINPALHMSFVNICVHKKFTLKRDLKDGCSQSAFSTTVKDAGVDQTVVCPQEPWRQTGPHPSAETRYKEETGCDGHCCVLANQNPCFLLSGPRFPFRGPPALPWGSIGGAGSAQVHALPKWVPGACLPRVLPPATCHNPGVGT